jgi:TPR repeat protein
MSIFERAIPGRSKPFARALLVVISSVMILALPLAAQGHGVKAVPQDADLRAQYDAGLTAYLDRDYATALDKWRPLAARKTESSAAQLFLGLMHAQGQGVAEDRAAAAEWYRRAADQDNMVAQVRLGLLYGAGNGVARDLVQAHLWASLATRRESHVQKMAQAFKEALRADMTPTQIAEAERLSATWRDSHRSSE